MEIINNGKEKNAVKVSVKGRMDAVSAPEFEQKMGVPVNNIFLTRILFLDFLTFFPDIR